MQTKRGIEVSPGVATGRALVLGTQEFRIPQSFVDINAVDSELTRFRESLEAVCEEIERNEKLASEQLGKQYGAIFAAHLQMIRDPNLIAEIEMLIRDNCYSPEYASSRVLRQYAKVFQNLGNRYLTERASDIFDLEKRLLTHLMGKPHEELGHLNEPVIVLAHDLTPSETARLNKDMVLGFATEVGGHTSHTAILAGALGIPAVVGVGHFLSDVSGGDTVIIDGYHGDVIIDPDEATRERYRDSVARFKSQLARLEEFQHLQAETKDGQQVAVRGNIEFPEEVVQCKKQGASGIGLYRTEFLYLETGRVPTEEDHYEAYLQVASAFPQSPVVIRTLDLGADKMPGEVKSWDARTTNPVLGLRSIRLTLQNLNLFKTQLRAILRAAVDYDIRVMFPLITTLLELRQAKMILGDVMDDLEENGIPFRRDIPVGMMVEVPAAALLAEEFAKEVDFFSIGTNDLIQYTLAVDRSDPSVASLYSAADPAILRLIQRVAEVGKQNGISVTVCGQMSSDPKYIPLLIGLGIRNVSVTPSSITELKEVIRKLEISQAVAIAEHAMQLYVARDIENYLREELRKICPDALWDF